MDLITPDLGLLFWQAITFLILVIILRRLAWKPILGTLKQREDSIEQSLRDAEKARDEMAKLKSDNQNLLAEARTERDQILKDAKAAAAKLVDDAKEQAGVEYKRIVDDARVAIENDKQAAMTEFKNLVANMSIEIAEKVLRKNLADDKAQKELVEEYIKDLDNRN